MRTSKKTWIWLIVILLLFITVSYFLVSKKPKEYPGYVSESPAPTGTKAFYTYLDNTVDKTDRWEHSPDFLTKQDNNEILLMIEPFFVPESVRMREYTDYVQAGNTIILFKNNPDGMFDVSTNPVMLQEDEARIITDQQGEEYKAIVPSPKRIEEEKGDEILLEDETGVLALKRPIGEGNLIGVNSPNWLTNDYILDENHLELIFKLLQTEEAYSTVLFDEYIHGGGHAPSTSALYPKWMLVLAMQLIVFMLLWLLYKGKRFGPVRIPREEMVRFSNEQTSALAAWYKKSKRYRDALELQADYLKLLLQEKWGIAYQRSWQDCSELLAKKDKQMSEEGAQRFTYDLTNLLNKESVNKQEYLAWSKKLDWLERRVEEE